MKNISFKPEIIQNNSDVQATIQIAKSFNLSDPNNEIETTPCVIIIIDGVPFHLSLKNAIDLQSTLAKITKEIKVYKAFL